MKRELGRWNLVDKTLSLSSPLTPMRIPVVVQYRHVHLSTEDVARLFGPDAILKPMARLGHRGQVVYRETVCLVGKHGRLEDVHVLGPARAQTQVELSAVEAFALGLNAPVRCSGDLKRAAGCGLVGPYGKIRSRACAIVPVRHLHCNPATARQLRVVHEDVVNLVVPGRPELLIEHVVVRVHPTFALEFHLGVDEAAAFWLATNDVVTIDRSSVQ